MYFELEREETEREIAKREKGKFMGRIANEYIIYRYEF